MSESAPHGRDLSLSSSLFVLLVGLVLYVLSMGPVYGLASRGKIPLETYIQLENTVYVPISVLRYESRLAEQVCSDYLSLFA